MIAGIITDIKEINTKTKEGQYLMMALALLTVTSRTDRTPWEVIDEIGKMVKDVYKEPTEIKDTDKI